MTALSIFYLKWLIHPNGYAEKLLLVVSRHTESFELYLGENTSSLHRICITINLNNTKDFAVNSFQTIYLLLKKSL